ncbi:hypothetical protein LOK49_LG07G03247 [Camellia lanceoleosa]|uniref:Uncharacterized protein n=1 Tax=Camellia lanceoleosa TaxID=1840588 RepID=A0ACC0H0M1_9ERIC|nr:hypothetical protein LOK49_LG07G03247 [Camellia lanceoleosa]
MRETQDQVGIINGNWPVNLLSHLLCLEKEAAADKEKNNSNDTFCGTMRDIFKQGGNNESQKKDLEGGFGTVYKRIMVQFFLILRGWLPRGASLSVGGLESLTRLLIGWPKLLSMAAFLLIGLPTLQQSSLCCLELISCSLLCLLCELSFGLWCSLLCLLV